MWWGYLLGAYTEHGLCGGGICLECTLTQTVWWGYLLGAYTERRLCGGGISLERTLNTDYVVGVFAWSVH